MIRDPIIELALEVLQANYVGPMLVDSKASREVLNDPLAVAELVRDLVARHEN